MNKYEMQRLECWGEPIVSLVRIAIELICERCPAINPVLQFTNTAGFNMNDQQEQRLNLHGVESVLIHDPSLRITLIFASSYVCISYANNHVIKNLSVYDMHSPKFDIRKIVKRFIYRMRKEKHRYRYE